MNLLDLGALLKRERERRGLSVRDVMEATKISRRNLNALEGGEAKLLPHPVYLKGYIRNYAHLVGLDAAPLVNVVEEQSDGDSGYLPQSAASPAAATSIAPEAAVSGGSVAQPVATPEPVPAPIPTAEPVTEPVTEPVAEQVADPVAASKEDVQPAPDEEPSQIRITPPAEGSKRARPKWPLLLVLLVVVVAGAMYLQNSGSKPDKEPEPVNATLPVVDNATQANATTDNATLDNASLTPSEPPVVEPAPAQPEATKPAPGSSVPSAKPLPPEAAPAVVSGSSVEVSRRNAAALAAAPAADAPATGMQQLVITAKANEACWVEVTEGGKRKSVTLKNGDSTRFEFSNKARVRLGNAGGVTFTLNGAAYPFEGERGATATVEISGR